MNSYVYNMDNYDQDSIVNNYLNLCQFLTKLSYDLRRLVIEHLLLYYCD